MREMAHIFENDSVIGRRKGGFLTVRAVPDVARIRIALDEDRRHRNSRSRLAVELCLKFRVSRLPRGVSPAYLVVIQDNQHELRVIPSGGGSSKCFVREPVSGGPNSPKFPAEVRPMLP